MTAPWRSLSALAALAVVAVATSADARIHSLTGNVRFQVGNGLPLPITFAAPPNGRVQEVPGATVRVHADPAGVASRIVLDPVQLSEPGAALNIPVFLSNPNVFQVFTNLTIQFPAQKVSFQPFGRTGAATVTFCPGNVVTPVGNPACNPPGVIPGLMRYTRTLNQFGGAAQASVAGSANAALRVASAPPCAFASGANPACQVIFANVTPPPSLAIGGAFGVATTVTRPGPSPGRFGVTANSAGQILSMTTTGLGPGVSYTVRSHAGPWTTGMLTISQLGATAPQIFVFSGSDQRAMGGPGGIKGTGSLSMVSGAVSDSNISGPNANRGWLNLVVGAQVSKTPAAPTHALVALLALMMLSGGFFLYRRRSRPAGV